MTVGQTFSQQGQRRREFYDGVLRIANNVRFLDIIAIEADHTLSALVTYAYAFFEQADGNTASQQSFISSSQMKIYLRVLYLV
jgi:hypothetical protein